MKSDLAILFALLLLFGATLVFVGQRNFALDALNDRLAAVEERAYARVPNITIEGRASVYAVDGEIVMEKKR